MKLFVKNLTHVDFSYFDADRGVLGESWHTDVVLEGKLNDESMICDFSIVKKLIKKWLDDNLDHTLAIPTEHPLVNCIQHPERTHFQFKGQQGNVFDCVAPHQAFAMLPMTQINAEHAARWVEAQIIDLLPAELVSLNIRFYSEAINGAQYQYSHGLKKHAGNCQRIAHGHRSTIEIYKDGKPAADLEADWAQRWHDIYLGTNEDLIDIETMDGHKFCQFSYISQQGQFDLSINQDTVYMLDCDTTVESLADHIATVLAAENPGHAIEVHAFEGIGKGAIANKQVEA